MSRIFTTIVLFSATCLNVFSADFSVRMVNASKELPKGAPLLIRGQVCNASGHPIQVAEGATGFMVTFNIRRGDGNPVTGCPPPMTYTPKCCTVKSLSAGWLQDYIRKVCYGNAVGELVVQMVLSSKGPYRQCDGTTISAWEGEIRSEEVRIAVTEPTGIDAEAYKEFNGDPVNELAKLMNELCVPLPSKPRRSPEATRAIISKYSSSTYAAYALFQLDRDFLPDETFLRPEILDMNTRIAKWTVDPSEPRPKELRSTVSIERALIRKEVISATLLHHIDFPYMYDFDYFTAISYCGTRDAKEARPLFQKCLSPDVPEPIRVMSKVYLDILDKKGIK